MGIYGSPSGEYRIATENETLRRERDDYRSRLEAAFARENIGVARIAELDARVRELEQTYLAEYQRASVAESALAAERDRVGRLREALWQLKQHEKGLTAAGVQLIDAALAQEEAHDD